MITAAQALVFVIGAAVFAPLATVASEPESDASAPPEAAAETEPPAAFTPSPPGRITGRVRQAGRAPRQKTVTNDVDVAACGRTLRPQGIRRDRKGGLAEVVLELRTLDDTPPDAPWPADQPLTTVEIDGCRLEPGVVVIPQGTSLDLRCDDGVLHELLTLPARNEVARLYWPRYKRRVQLPGRHFETPERMRVTCERHGWTSGTWVVREHRLVTVSDDAGRFVLEDVPPGPYLLRAWHSELEELVEEVVISSGEATELELTYR
ncbi:MAG: hypothetical protein AAF533_06525 [Acidobacteriota bacterium]